MKCERRQSFALVAVSVALAIFVLADSPATSARKHRSSPTPSATASAEPTQTPSAEPTQTPSAEPTATPRAAPSAALPPVPNALKPTTHSDWLLGGIWQCTTTGGTHLTHAFSRSDDGSAFLVDTDLAIAKHPVAALGERYQHHVASQTWSATLAGGTIVLAASEWNGASWTFTGTSTNGRASEKTRMTYTQIDSDAFRRDFARAIASGWKIYAGERCGRTERF